MIDLPDLIELVSERPERFVIFCDDLSFDEGEAGYKALKSIRWTAPCLPAVTTS